MNKATPVLETRNLQKSFGAVTAARDISDRLAVERTDEV